MSGEVNAPEQQANRLLPVLQEGVEIVKMILYRQIQGFIAQRLPELEPAGQRQLAGAIINDLFAAPHELPAATAALIQAQREAIDRERITFFTDHPEQKLVLTDALRVQTLCDLSAGHPDPRLLQRAEAAGLLLTDRELPLPHTFIDLARRLGKAHGLITPLTPEKQPPGNEAVN